MEGHFQIVGLAFFGTWPLVWFRVEMAIVISLLLLVVSTRAWPASDLSENYVMAMVKCLLQQILYMLTTTIVIV